MDALDESDLEEIFSSSSGPGGQNVNKVATKVTLTHVPTGLSVSVQDSRSQATNRELARERLLTLINETETKQRQAAKQAKEKARRRNAPRPRKVKERILDSKKRRSVVKQNRKKFRPGDDH